LWKEDLETERPTSGFKAVIGQTYKFSSTVNEESAEYSIDGEVYATTTFTKD
jgi:hypothetical protein